MKIQKSLTRNWPFNVLQILTNILERPGLISALCNSTESSWLLEKLLEKDNSKVNQYLTMGLLFVCLHILFTYIFH